MASIGSVYFIWRRRLFDIKIIYPTLVDAVVMECQGETTGSR
jgi:hypothetical protein